uniref:Rpn family recombination-promoting nuclease/putative transposase n=1 Tax=Desulfobotulus mexicanus TaxID=2586642 RepID=A0A5S5MBR2_9BACT
MNQMLTDFYVKPTSDIFIKYLFGKEEHKPILIDFINAVMKNSGFPLITDLVIKNPFNIQTILNAKETILDIKAKSSDGRWIDIEMQNSDKGFFGERALYYWTALYGDQLVTGDNYATLRPVVCINILDFKMFKNVDRYHLCFMLREKDTPELLLTDHLSLHFLELPKLTAYNLDKSLDNWLYYLKNEGLNKEDEIMENILKNNPQIANAREKYMSFTQDEHMREAYNSHIRWKRDHDSALFLARNEGRHEEKFQTIMELLDFNMKPEEIARITRLSPEKVKAVIAAGDKGLDLLMEDDKGAS